MSIPKHLRFVATAACIAGFAASCGGDGAPNTVTAPKVEPPALAEVVGSGRITFQCDASAGGPGYSNLSATGQLDSRGVPVAVSVFPSYAPSTVESYRKVGALVAGYATTPSFPRWQAWNVTGHASNIGNEGDLYYLVLPKVLPGRGGVVPGEIHVEFAGGANGGWQAIGLCLIG